MAGRCMCMRCQCWLSADRPACGQLRGGPCQAATAGSHRSAAWPAPPRAHAARVWVYAEGDVRMSALLTRQAQRDACPRQRHSRQSSAIEEIRELQRGSVPRLVCSRGQYAAGGQYAAATGQYAAAHRRRAGELHPARVHPWSRVTIVTSNSQLNACSGSGGGDALLGRAEPGLSRNLKGCA